MRILFFSDNFMPECCAPAIHVYERARLWVEWGHQVTVVTCAPNWPEGKVYDGYRNAWRQVEVIDGIRVVRVKSYVAPNEGFLRRSLDYISYVIPAFLAAVGEVRPDVVISTSPQLFTPVAGTAFARYRRVPHVFELRDLWPASILATDSMKAGVTYRLLERLELSLYHRSTRILATTEHYRLNLSGRGIPPDKIDVVMTGANLRLFSPRSRDQEIARMLGVEDRFVVGYLGTLGLAHGLENVIEAAARLIEEPITFLFTGWGAAKKRLEELAQERGLSNVIFLPRQPHETMPRFWSVCDVSLVHTRNAEVFRSVIPSKIFESMAMGLPIVYAGPEGEGTRLVERHDVGLGVAPEDPGALAEVVSLLAHDRDMLARLAANGPVAAQMYSRERHAERSLQVLQSALAANSRVESEVAQANP